MASDSFTVSIESFAAMSDKTETSNTPTKPHGLKTVDRGYSWVILAATFGVQAFHLAVLGCNTLTFSEVQRRFQLSAAEAGWIFSTFSGIRMMSSPFLSPLFRVLMFRTMAISGATMFAFGVMTSALAGKSWMLSITYSFIAGIGSNVMIVALFGILTDYFDRFRFTANSLSSLGMNTGAIIAPQLVSRSYAYFGYTQTLIYLACVALQAVPLSTLYRPQPKRKNSITDSGRDVTEKTDNLENQKTDTSLAKKFLSITGLHFVRNWYFCIYAISMMFMFCAYVSNTIYISGIALEQAGLNTYDVATVLSITAFVEFGKALVGFSFDIPVVRSRRMYMCAVLMVIMGILEICLAFTSSFGSLTTVYTSCMFIGAAIMSQQYSLLAEILPTKQLTQGFGLCRFLYGLGLFIIPSAVGRVKDNIGSYRYAVIAMGLCMALSAIVFVITIYSVRRKKEIEA